MGRLGAANGRGIWLRGLMRGWKRFSAFVKYVVGYGRKACFQQNVQQMNAALKDIYLH